MMLDVLVIGSGPAGLAIAAALGQAALRVAGLTPAPDASWPNTYGIWVDDLEALGFAHLLERRWSDCVVYVGERRIDLGREYGVFDNAALQAHLWARAEQGGVVWHAGYAAQATHHAHHSEVVTRDGARLAARLVVDAGGHAPRLVKRPPAQDVAYQAAYGVVGRFSAPPVDPGQVVLMDYRTDHLAAPELHEPPTFLYAMDLGDGRFFAEETSLAHAPAVSLEVLKGRLMRRLAQRGIQVTDVEQVERCLFPMDLPLPWREQPVLGYGGAASMVHPVSGYQVGAALRFAPVVAEAVAAALAAGDATPVRTARAGWDALWLPARLRRRELYRFGLANVLRFDARQTQEFFAAFFGLPQPQWTGYLSDTLSTPELLRTMLALFTAAPVEVRRTLTASVARAGDHLWRAAQG